MEVRSASLSHQKSQTLGQKFSLPPTIPLSFPFLSFFFLPYHPPTHSLTTHLFFSLFLPPPLTSSWSLESHLQSDKHELHPAVGDTVSELCPEVGKEVLGGASTGHARH